MRLCWGPEGREEWVKQGRLTPTYLVEQLWQLDLHLLSLEHVVFSLLTDGWDQVELPSHRVGLLSTEGDRCISRPEGHRVKDTGTSQVSLLLLLLAFLRV